MAREKSHTDDTIFSRLKSARKALGLSQAAFAEKIGLKQSSYNEIETGKREPQQTIISSMAYRLAINEDWLKTGQGEMFKEGKGEATATPPPLDNDLLEKALKMVRNLAKDVPICPEQEAKLLGDAYKGFYEVKYKGKEGEES